MSQIHFSNHKMSFTFQKNSIAISTNPDEDLLLNQNLSIIIISHSKIILIKYFRVKRKIEIDMRWQINKLSNISFSFILPFLRTCVEKRKISYFGLTLSLFQHLISPNQDDLSYSARTFISGFQNG